MAIDAGGVTLKSIKIGADCKACPLISDVDGNKTSLGEVLDAMQTDLETVVVSGLTAVDLSGSGVTVFVFVADRAYTISGANFVFTEASSADTGSNISVGKVFVGTDDVDYFVNEVASDVSKETGYRQSLTLLQTAVVAGDVITLVSAGGKTGTGEGVLQLLLTKT